jgi:chromosome segregation ATPase
MTMTSSSYSSSDCDDINLKRQIETLQEQIDIYEMKYDTLEAATEQFRLKTKALSKKLEEERKLYEKLQKENHMLQSQMEQQIQILIEKETTQFDQYKVEQSIKQNELETTIETLTKKLQRAEEQKVQLQKDHQQLEASKQSIQESYQNEIDNFKSQLNDSEQQVASLEQSLKATLADEKEKDTAHQQELRKRIEEATRWEARIKELNAEKQETYIKLKGMEKLLAESRSSSSTYEQRLTKSKATIDELEEVIRKKEHEYSTKAKALRIINKQLEDETQHLSISYKDVLEKLENERLQFNETIVTAQEEIERTIKEKIDLKQELVLLTKRLNTTATKSTQCTQTFESMQLQYSGLDQNLLSVQNQLNMKNSQYQRCDTNLRSLTEQQNQLQNKLDTTEQDLQDCRYKYTELEIVTLQHNKDLAELRSSHDDVVTQLAVTQNNLKATESELSDIKIKIQNESESEGAGNSGGDGTDWSSQMDALLSWVGSKFNYGMQVIVNLPNLLPELNVSTTTSFYERFKNAMVTLVEKVLWVHHTLMSFFHDAISSVVSSLPTDSNGGGNMMVRWLKLILSVVHEHGRFIVVSTEVICALLCIDIILSSLILRRSPSPGSLPTSRRKQQQQYQYQHEQLQFKQLQQQQQLSSSRMIHVVPKSSVGGGVTPTEQVSLLRKATNFQKEY